METPQVINFEAKPRSDARYRFLRVPLNNIPSGSITITGAQQLLEWKLPSACYNLSRSFIQYSLRQPGQGAGNFTWNFEDISLGELASSVTFGTASGLNLVDLNYLANYTKVTSKVFMESNEFTGRDVINSVYPNSIFGYSSASAVSAAGADNLLPLSITPAAGNIYGLANAATFVSPFKVSDARYTNVSGNGAVSVRNRQILLSDVKNTLLSEDKDIYCPVEMYLRVISQPANRVGYISTSAADPTIGAATVAAASFDNIVLYLAVEQNQEIIDSLVGSIRDGSHSFQIPFTVGFRAALAANSLTSTQIQFNSQYGKKLHHVLSVVNSTAETLNASVDSSNYNASKILTYQTYLDNRPLQDQVLNCAQPITTAALVNSDDWRENSKFVINSYMNYGQYQLNWFHMDAFYDPMTGDEGLDLTNNDQGLDMDAVRLYQLQATTNAANGCTLYTYETFLRDVMIDPQGNILFG